VGTDAKQKVDKLSEQGKRQASDRRENVPCQKVGLALYESKNRSGVERKDKLVKGMNT